MTAVTETLRHIVAKIRKMGCFFRACIRMFTEDYRL